MEPNTTAPAKHDPPKDLAPKNGKRLRRACFTLNNPTDAEYHWLTTTWPAWSNRNPTWMIIGKEVGETGTSHLQGAFTLNTQVAFSTIKTWPGFRRAHLEQMHGTPLDSKLYCSKQDLQPFEFGILPTPGKRTDLIDACAAVKAGQSLREMSDEHATVIVKYYKGLTILRSLRSAPRNPDSLPPTIYWLHGKTGVGKTKRAWELGCALASPSDIWLSHSGTTWFDGYDGQRIAIFDDFRSKGTRFEFLLRLTDRYPLQVPFKGGFVNWNPEVIIFTSPYPIEGAFEARKMHRPEDVAQLIRRTTADFCFDWPEEIARFEQLIANAGRPVPAPVPAVTSMSISATDSSSLPATQPYNSEHSDEDMLTYGSDCDLSFDWGSDVDQ